MKLDSRIFGLLALPVVAILMFVAAEIRPGYFSNLTFLGGLLLLEVVFALIWHYEKWFFVGMILAFIWGGSALPLAGAGSAARWVFLIVGAMVGVIKWVEQDRRQHFGGIHLIAALCILSAAVSSMVSIRTQTSLLKTASVFFVFLYASCGVRVAVAGRERAFFRGLVTACEITSFLSAFLYLILHFPFFGNPNSLGAVMGVVVVPILLWGVLVAEDQQVRQRRLVALALAAFLLVYATSRAGILASAVSLTVACIALRRTRLLMKGAFAVVFLTAALAVVQVNTFDNLVASFTEDVIYKGKPEEGLFGSRKSPWQETVDVIKESPWFGSGFGTDRLQTRQGDSVFRTNEGTNREHGNSYLALLEYVGLLGVVPFAVMIALLLRMIYLACSWMRRTGDHSQYFVPLTLICTAGLVHAVFEDWLFAVGYYLSVFFWIHVFLLSDLLPRRVHELSAFPRQWRNHPVPAGRVPLTASQFSTNRYPANQ